MNNIRTFSWPFVDLSKAFDTVSRELLWGIILRFGCPDKFVNILCQFHDGMMARVAIGGQESVPFGVHIGVRERCMLAPVLFNIFLLCVTQLLYMELEDSSGIAVDFRLDGNQKAPSTKVAIERVLELQYADDCALVAHTPEGLQSILVMAVRVCSRIGLSINPTKTEVVCQWRSSPPLTIEHKSLTIVTLLVYLGNILSEDCSMDPSTKSTKRQQKQFMRHTTMPAPCQLYMPHLQ